MFGKEQKRVYLHTKRPHKYSKEQKQFLLNNAFGISNIDLTKLFNEYFKTELSLSQIKRIKYKLKIRSGLTGRFEKGNSPHNKGKNWDEFMSVSGQYTSRKTTFKKGSIPHNHRPIGSERITIDGYIEVKIAEPKKWKMKHVLVWERINGTVPKGHVVIFADGNRGNFKIDNLILVSRAELVRMNKNHLIFSNPESTKSGVIIARLMNKAGELNKRKVKCERAAHE